MGRILEKIFVPKIMKIQNCVKITNLGPSKGHTNKVHEPVATKKICCIWTFGSRELPSNQKYHVLSKKPTTNCPNGPGRILDKNFAHQKIEISPFQEYDTFSTLKSTY